jgi:hypothetical protein
MRKEKHLRRRRGAHGEEKGRLPTGAIVGQGEKCHYSRTVRAAEANLQRDETGHSPNARMDVEGETDWALIETQYWGVVWARAGVADFSQFSLASALRHYRSNPDPSKRPVSAFSGRCAPTTTSTIIIH